MSHKEELVKKCSLESHNTPQNKQKMNVEMKTGVYILYFFWNSEDKYKSGLPLSLEPNNGHISQKMSHKEELVKKRSLEYHNTPQIKYLRI